MQDILWRAGVEIFPHPPKGYYAYFAMESQRQIYPG
jgi:hypothetical protein